MKLQATEDLFHLGIKALIRNQEGQVLLLKFNPKLVPGKVWDLPGGRVKKSEAVHTTLKREVREELGPVKLTIGKHIGMTLANIRIPLEVGHDVGLILSIYECILAEKANLVLSDDHIQYEWFSPLQAADLLRIKYPSEFCKLIAQLR